MILIHCIYAWKYQEYRKTILKEINVKVHANEIPYSPRELREIEDIQGTNLK